MRHKHAVRGSMNTNLSPSTLKLLLHAARVYKQRPMAAIIKPDKVLKVHIKLGSFYRMQCNRIFRDYYFKMTMEQEYSESSNLQQGGLLPQTNKSYEKHNLFVSYNNSIHLGELSVDTLEVSHIRS